MKKSLLVVLGAAILSWGCSQAPPEPAGINTPASVAATAAPDVSATPPASEFTWEASPEDKAKAEELMAAAKDGKLPYKELSVKENGPAFVHIVLTVEDPKMVSGALQGIKKVYSPDKAYKKTNQADESVDQAVLKALRSENPEVLHHALRAAGKALGKEPNQEVIDLLVKIATEHKQVGARHEALDALTSVDQFDKNPQVTAVFLKALKDDAPVASLALFRHRFGFTRGDKADEFKAIMTELISHQDPGVRGRAIERFAEYNSDNESLILEKVEPLLKDKNSYVRAAAVGALSRLKDPKAIHLIMTLMDDTESNTYDIKYENLLGSSDTVHHDGSAWSRVNDAALYALESASRRLPEAERFDYGDIDYKKVDENIAAEAKKAKAWYAEFKKKNPGA